MRLFTGIDLPKETANKLDLLISRLRTLAQLKWSPAYNLHITTKFIGDWPQDRLEELITKLRTVPSRKSLDIQVRGLGWFPNPHHPHVFWAGVQGGPPLAELARDTDRA